ncbi:MAG: hypothetical protein AAF735_05240 [Myxococcota bacterium]
MAWIVTMVVALTSLLMGIAPFDDDALRDARVRQFIAVGQTVKVDVAEFNYAGRELALLRLSGRAVKSSSAWWVFSRKEGRYWSPKSLAGFELRRSRSAAVVFGEAMQQPWLIAHDGDDVVLAENTSDPKVSVESMAEDFENYNGLVTNGRFVSQMEKACGAPITLNVPDPLSRVGGPLSLAVADACGANTEFRTTLRASGTITVAPRRASETRVDTRGGEILVVVEEMLTNPRAILRNALLSQ